MSRYESVFFFQDMNLKFQDVSLLFQVLNLLFCYNNNLKGPRKVCYSLYPIFESLWLGLRIVDICIFVLLSKPDIRCT